MEKAALVIMAAGMGSRYGGLKQIDPVDEQGNKIIDFSIYDAIRAGFEKIVFVIKKEHEADFRSCISDRIGNRVKIAYAYQELENIPEDCSVPDGRVKPCLHSPLEFPVKGLDYEGMRRQFLAASAAKPERHGVLSYGSHSRSGRSMNRIGG